MSEKIFLSKAEQLFLMEQFEVDNATEGAEQFALLLVIEKVDPTQLQKYLKKVMKRMKEKK